VTYDRIISLHVDNVTVGLPCALLFEIGLYLSSSVDLQFQPTLKFIWYCHIAVMYFSLVEFNIKKVHFIFDSTCYLVSCDITLSFNNMSLCVAQDRA